ncbi:glutamate--tRNA ligase [Inquilinus sp. CAU 1745]|uniref:glutamate--tRNA ligase n=1 Tax=Inquilinus sp. CAU 1745 TaxID=3140369 RepID=UPI00325A97BA
MTVVTRFAPSPTGYLHIGGARTALFNWLFSRHHGGKFLLRIEDTDRARSTDDAITKIIEGLDWLGLVWDGDAVSQFERRDRHADLARRLLSEGKAYHCYASPEELAEMREKAKAEGRPIRYDGRWRDRDPKDAPNGVAPVIRLKAPLEGETVVEDQVQGPVTVANAQLDDMVLLRADGTPTYMLSVVVDDIDMGITHVIRGDDHLTNAFRQTQLYRALDATPPVFAHIPLIHGPDGAKLSKRHGALGVEAYREMGFLPAAMRNYLLRLGWGHGDEEVISTAQAIEWFDLDGIGRSPSRLDFAKLENLNGIYIREAPDTELAAEIQPRVAEIVGHPLNDEERARIEAGMIGLKPRAKTLKELAENAAFYARRRPLAMDEKAGKLLTPDGIEILAKVAAGFEALPDWTEEALEGVVRDLAEAEGLKLGKIAQPLRAALTGSGVSPGIFEVARVLGREESLERLNDVVAKGVSAAPAR